METQLTIACDLGFATEADIQTAIAIETKIGKLLNGLIRYTIDQIHRGESIRIEEKGYEYGTDSEMI